MKRLFLFAVLLLDACGPQATPTSITILRPTASLSSAAATSILPAPTAIPVTCADLDAAWTAADWPTALQVLDRLRAANLTCGEDSLNGKHYSILINYAVSLENSGNIEAAIVLYQAALAINGRGAEALDALIRLNALPTPTTPPCNPGVLELYTVSTSQPFVAVKGDLLIVDSTSFVIRGVNYYPRRAPWDRFLIEGNLDEMKQELDLIASAGFNTLRIFLWYDSLFTCASEDAIPNAETFAKLDAFITLAKERNLRLVVTLNDLPDLIFRPLYTDWAHYDSQTTFIVNRYRDEPAILAWDLRNEGDIDYGAHPSFSKRFEREKVLTWLAHTANVIRANDPNHLLTAGWWGDSADTADVMDILSFHHWTSSLELNVRIEALKAKTTKPILVEEVGYSSWGDSGETGQAQALGDTIATAEKGNTSGWLIWTAFDFIPPDGRPPNVEHFFGLWHTDLTPKPALEAVSTAIAP